MTRHLTILAAIFVARAASGAIEVQLQSPGPGPNTFAVLVTTDETFNTLEILIDGDVANGQNIIPIDPILSEQVYFSSGTILSPLGSPGTLGVLDPGMNADMELTLGVITPMGAAWTEGLSLAPTLQLDLVSGGALVTVNLLSAGNLVNSASIQAIQTPGVPEPSMLIVFGGLMLSASIAGLRARTRVG